MKRDIVSVRLSDAEDRVLRSVAAARGLTISDCVRGMVAAAVAPPTPAGVSVGYAGPPLVQVAPGRYVQPGVYWSDGTVGLERTICVSEPRGPADETHTSSAFSPRQP